MVGSLLSELAIIVVLMIANGVFAASELALVSARRSRLEQHAAMGDKRAARAIALAEEPDRLLATVQVGITLIGTFAAAFGGAKLGEIVADSLENIPAVAAYAETLSLALVVLLITYLSLIIGELVPKRLAIIHTEGVALTFAPVLTFLSKLARPVVWFLTLSTTAVLKLLRQNKAAEESVTEEDILYLTRQGRAGGTVALHEQRLIENVFDFSDRTARMLMTPRPDVVAVSNQTPLREIALLSIEHGFSRLPVYEGDSLDKAIGVVHIKDVLPTLLHDVDQQLSSILRPPSYVLDTEPVTRVLARFRRDGTHMGLVVDEYGQIAGVLTLEDILEELVGEIRDEHDEAEDASMVQRDDGSWLIDGAESISIVAEHLGLKFDEEHADYYTLAGFVLNSLGRLAQVGDTAHWDDWIVEVVDTDGRRVDRVLLRQYKLEGETE